MDAERLTICSVLSDLDSTSELLQVWNVLKSISFHIEGVKICVKICVKHSETELI